MKTPFRMLLCLCFIFANALTLYAAKPLSPAGAPAVQGNLQVGIVAAVRGTVKVQKSGQGQIGNVIESGAPIFMGDVITTDGESRLQILLKDETVFTVGPNSSIVIDKFVYDPGTQDGKVDARAIKGVFRLVTGKIARKKPENVSVKVPNGTIGIRGTILLFEVANQDTLAVLFGPGEKNNTGSNEGSFILEGENTTKVDETGKGATLDETGKVSEEFDVPPETLSRMQKTLESPKGQSKQNTGNNQGGSGTNNNEGDDTDEGDDSLSDDAGQDDVEAEDDLDDAGDLGDDLGDLDDDLDDAAQDFSEEDAETIADGQTTLDDLLFESAQNQGLFHYSETNVQLVTNGSNDGTYDFQFDIDFGAQTVGGGNSEIDVSGNGLISDQSFGLGLKNFDDGLGGTLADYAFQFSDTGCGSSACSIDVVVRLQNEGGNVAETADHEVTIVDPNLSFPNNQSDGDGNADRFSGLS